MSWPLDTQILITSACSVCSLFLWKPLFFLSVVCLSPLIQFLQFMSNHVFGSSYFSVCVYVLTFYVVFHSVKDIKVHLYEIVYYERA